MDKTTAKVVSLFDELILRGEEIKKSCTRQYFAGQKNQLPAEQFGEWRTNCLSLLKSTFGSSSPQFDSFVNSKIFDFYNSTQIYLGILRGARTDLQRGYFFHKDLMLSVNIFDSLLARARRLVERKELERAAGVLEAVVEEILCKICENRKVAHDGVEGVEALCDLVERAGGLPEEAGRRLREVGHMAAGSSAGAPAVSEALDWVTAFLDSYLGARILILN